MPDSTYSSQRVGQRVRDARKARGLTQRQLAQRMSCSLSLLTKVESGHAPASPSFTAAAARALKVRLAQLTGQPYEDPQRGRVHATIPDVQTSMLSWDLPDDTLPVRPYEELAADVATASGLGRKARYAKLGVMLPPLLDELSAACHAAERGAERERLFGLLAEAYSGVTAIAYALGLFDLRSQAMDRVRWAARESGDPLRVGRTQWQRSTLFFQAAAYDRGLRLLERVHHDLGEDITHMAPPALSVHGAVHLRSAMFAARAGNRPTATAHLDAAAETAARLGRDANHYGVEFGPANVLMHRLGVAVELGDGPGVVHWTGQRLPADVAPVRAGRWWIDAAKGWLDYGNQEKSLAALQTARRVSPEQTRNHPQVRETTATLIHLERYGKESLTGLASWLGIT
ncbi:hypothetical protein SRB5_14480 [Streptomyces sp. RB5]|uniref:HTH cro/C1-type domain-containing protein n=1 Tax=Streptomyces smaragdinus TaxID=2585196 RepID=A0A7K0CDB2_9ACTN|nr:helix-turn-helix domain-containing protein [Streptomyces smaragdinus]MQY11333.1 hypothetical protein [Streptomyces smaragdinus]